MEAIYAMVGLITGVSSEHGLGFAVARELARQGYSVVLTTRNESTAHTLTTRLVQEGYDVTACTLDITNQDSIIRCVNVVTKKFGMLDALINNAAAGFDIEQNTIGADLTNVEKAFSVNLFGAWRMCDAFIPLLQKSPQGRIVNISSEAASFESPNGLRHPFIKGMLPGYSLSKNALNAYTVKLSEALEGTTVLVNAVCPGHTASHPETGDEEGARSAAESAKGIVWAATLPENGPSGQFFHDGVPLSF